MMVQDQEPKCSPARWTGRAIWRYRNTTAYLTAAAVATLLVRLGAGR